MKILQVIKPYGMGGVERIAASLQKNLKEAGYDTYIAISSNMRDNFLSHFTISDDKNIISYDDSNVFSFIISLKKIIKTINPDVIQTHARKECFLVSLINKNIPHVRTQHMSESPKIKVTKFEKKLLKRRVSAWIATSISLKENYLKSLDYIEQEKVFPVYNGVVKAQRTKNDTYSPNFKYCIIARLSIQKGIDILIKEMAEMPKELLKKIRVDIYGEGEEKENLLNMVDSYGLKECIKYCGTTNKPSDIIINYDAFLMPSRYEGLPLTMLESMSTGTPVATHNVGCVKEFTNHGSNGWIVDENYSWKNFFEDALDKSNIYKNISNNAMQTYLEKFSEEKMVEGYLAIYNRCNR